MNKMEATQFARTLRKNCTESEKLFWNKVRKRQIHGLKFLRQYKIEYAAINGSKHFFFPDFYCHEIRLVVEIDGDIHNLQKAYDIKRQKIL